MTAAGKTAAGKCTAGNSSAAQRTPAPASSGAAPAAPGEAFAALRERSAAVLFQNYRRAPIAFVSGRGARLTTTDGRTVLDFLAGIATNSLGHGYPRLVHALQNQAERYLHVSNLYEVPEQIEAAERLVSASRLRADLRGFERVFFCNSGAEAVEALIKLARRWGVAQGRSKVVSTVGGFHGRTLGALAATGTPAYHEGFQPLPGGFQAVPYRDFDALAEALDATTCAVLLETIQGEGGVLSGGVEYLQAVQGLCRERGVLLFLDEVQTGIGRTGEMFAFQHFGLEPDAISLAKGLGGGVPVGAVLATDELAAHLVPGTHGTTFGGNALAMAAVIAVQRALLEDGVLQGVEARAQRLRHGLEALQEDLPVSEVRGAGLMLAIELRPGISGSEVAERSLQLGLLINAVRPQSLRIVPPLVVSEQEIDEALVLLRRAIEQTVQANAGVST